MHHKCRYWLYIEFDSVVDHCILCLISQSSTGNDSGIHLWWLCLLPSGLGIQRKTALCATEGLKIETVWKLFSSDVDNESILYIHPCKVSFSYALTFHSAQEDKFPNLSSKWTEFGPMDKIQFHSQPLYYLYIVKCSRTILDRKCMQCKLNFVQKTALHLLVVLHAVMNQKFDITTDFTMKIFILLIFLLYSIPDNKKKF